MLTKKQHAVYQFIVDHVNQHGYSPSYEEIANGIGTSSRGSVLKHIKALEEAELIERKENTNRSIRLVHNPEVEAPMGVPLVGKIAAGRPIMAFEHVERVDLNHFFSHGKPAFLLVVQGDSMKDGGIYEGDYVLIQPSQTARDGQIVVALVDGYDTTLKRFHHNGRGTITLVPENNNMQPMTYPEERVQIQGIMIALIRRHD